MNFFISAFNTILYQPLFNALVLLYLYIPGRDFGVAVILFTILIKLFLYPLASKGIRSQKALQELQPKIKEVQNKHKDDKHKQSMALMELYKQEKVNPLSGLLPLLVQLPILIALFRLFWNGFGPEQFSFLYSFIPNPGQVNTSFLGLIDLAEASVILAVVTGVAQFFQTKMLTPASAKASAGRPSSDFSSIMQKQMLYLFPIFTIFILWRMPAAIALYWLTTTVFTIGQQYIILKKNERS
ncbi:MAG: membrane protein insertase YidC [Candidatus Nealsonbacteria bacterium]|nr:membrane protein insertase YidC [Candidatus Nealsonbacteria bacterium]